MTRLTHKEQHAASLTHEQRAEVRRTIFLWALVPLAMAVISMGLLAKEQLETSHHIEQLVLRDELTAIENRIDHEECLYRPLRVIHRDKSKADFCPPNESLPDLKARRDLLDARLRAKGAYDERRE